MTYRVAPDGTLVVVFVVAHRADDECYELAAARLKQYRDRKVATMAAELLDGAFRKRRQGRLSERVC